MAPVEHRFTLPSVEIQRGQRIAESLTAAMKKIWSYELACLFCPEISVPPGQSRGIHYQVMQCCQRTQEHAGRRTQWVRLSQLSRDSFADPADYEAVRQCLAQCDAYARDLAPGPFAKPGWFHELQVWVEEVIGPMGFRLQGGFCQFNASPSFSLIRFETNGPAIWFKAVGEPNLREFPITIALARLFPKYTPQVLATRPEWNGWLALEIAGAGLEATHNAEHWKSAANDLADLQIDSIGKRCLLLDHGARDLRANTLSGKVQPFLDVMAQLMEERSKIPPTALTRRQLMVLGEHLKDALSLLGQLGIPDTLGHLDLNPANIIVSPSGSKFLDWAEACVGHPFFSLEYLQEYFRRSVSGNPGREYQLVASYTAPWRALFSADAVAKALSIAPMLAVFAYAVGNDIWFDPEKRQQPGMAGYLRSLTRRIQREADLRIGRRSRCQS